MSINLSESEYAKRTRSILEIMKGLRDIGVSTPSLHITIPLLVIIGNQSAGKSSLVEVISGVRVPRAGGTCTRCPMEVNIRRASGAWSCQVYLRFEYDAAGARLDVTRKIPFGEQVTDKTEISKRLMRAQIAILNNAEENRDMFLRLTDPEIERYRSSNNGTPKFSRNAIVIDVSDPSPNCVDISFVDLPGLIQNDTDENVDLVKNLVKSFIKTDCLILVAAPLSNDIATHGAIKLASEADPEKNRTVGVLTKPDLLSPGSRKEWLEILDGTHEKHALKLGYFCVKLSDDAERSPPDERDRHEAMEDAFFANSPPWDQFQNRGQLGVKNLVKNLSKNLMALLDNALPRLFESLKEQTRQFRQELSVIPQPSIEDSPSLEVSKRICSFHKDLDRTISGVDVSGRKIAGGEQSFVQQNRSTYFSFKKAIRSTAPIFQPIAIGNPSERDDAEEVFNEERRVLDPGITLPGPPSTKDFTLARDYIEGSRGWENESVIPYTVRQVLVGEFVELWKLPTMQCFDNVSVRLEKVLNDHVTKNFGQFPPLCEHILPIVLKLFEDQRGEAQRVVENILLLESEAPYSPYTQNNEDFLSSQKKWAARYAKTISQRAAEQVSVVSEIAASVLEQAAESVPVVGNVIRNVIDGALNSDGSSSDSGSSSSSDVVAYEGEREVMAFVRAYFDVSYKRFIDYIPLIIESSLNKRLLNTIQHGIEEKLQLYDPEQAKAISDMLHEAEEVEERRAYLKEKIILMDKQLLHMRQLGFK